MKQHRKEGESKTSGEQLCVALKFLETFMALTSPALSIDWNALYKADYMRYLEMSKDNWDIVQLKPIRKS